MIGNQPAGSLCDVKALSQFILTGKIWSSNHFYEEKKEKFVEENLHFCD